MPQPSFREWVEQKVKEAGGGRAERLADWRRAYKRLRDEIERWLKEDGGGEIEIADFPVMRTEQGLGVYHLDGFSIRIGDSAVKVLPVSRNVIARIKLPDGGELPGEGLVDITGGGTKYHLYRTIQDGKDVWYVVDEKRHPSASRQRDVDMPLTRERFQEILMDLMS
jgi:hypothetical protein